MLFATPYAGSNMWAGSKVDCVLGAVLEKKKQNQKQHAGTTVAGSFHRPCL
jgi:hypothetical protein